MHRGCRRPPFLSVSDAFHHPDRPSEVRSVAFCLSSCCFVYRVVSFVELSHFVFRVITFACAILLSLVYRVVNIVVFCLSSCKLAKILLRLSESVCFDLLRRFIA